MIKALAITGPTASGKTALSLKIARSLGCEIISLDSMQIYKHMDIGTAKATAEERAAVPHYLIDFLLPNESFSAKSYRTAALDCAQRIEDNGKIPLFVGGTGLYISTLLRPECEEAPESDPSYRERIFSDIKCEKDKIALFERLRRIDPQSADSMHYNNVKRVVRALEIYDATGKPKSYFDALTKAENGEIAITHLTLDFHKRENLYARVNERVDAMIRDGLVEEVKALLGMGFLAKDTTAAQAIGYKEIARAIAGEATLSEAIEEVKRASRNYAKRQLTWFRHMEKARTVYVDGEDGKMKNLERIFDEAMNTLSLDS